MLVGTRGEERRGRDPILTGLRPPTRPPLGVMVEGGKGKEEGEGEGEGGGGWKGDEEVELELFVKAIGRDGRRPPEGREEKGVPYILFGRWETRWWLKSFRKCESFLFVKMEKGRKFDASREGSKREMGGRRSL